MLQHYSTNVITHSSFIATCFKTASSTQTQTIRKSELGIRTKKMLSRDRRDRWLIRMPNTSPPTRTKLDQAGQQKNFFIKSKMLKNFLNIIFITSKIFRIQDLVHSDVNHLRIDLFLAQDAQFFVLVSF
jgi:hypothetical protein